MATSSPRARHTATLRYSRRQRRKGAHERHLSVDRAAMRSIRATHSRTTSRQYCTRLSRRTRTTQQVAARTKRVRRRQPIGSRSTSSSGTSTKRCITTTSWLTERQHVRCCFRISPTLLLSLQNALNVRIQHASCSEEDENAPACARLTD